MGIDLSFVSDRFNYLDKIVYDYRHDIIDFFPESEEDKKLVDRLKHILRTYEINKGTHEEGLSRTENLRIHAVRIPHETSKNLNILQLERTKTSTEFLELYDRAKTRSLVRPTEDFRRKLETCQQDNDALQRKLHDAQEETERLRKLVRLLGGDPDSTDSFIGDVEGGEPHEQH